MKHRLLYLIIVVISASSCDNLFVTTQKEDMKIELRDDISAIYADGESRLDFKIILPRRPGSSERIDVDISSGSLVNLSGLQVDSDQSNSHITVHPTRQELSFGILSSKIPNDKVVLGVRCNGKYISKIVSFSRKCPDEIHFDLLKNRFPISENSQTIGKIDLSSREHHVSSATRIDVILSNSRLAISESRIFYNGEGINLNMLSLGEEGDLDITVRVNEGLCGKQEITRRITLFKP